MNKKGMVLAIMEFSFSDTFHLETHNKQVNRLIKSFVIVLSTMKKREDNMQETRQREGAFYSECLGKFSLMM